MSDIIQGYKCAVEKLLSLARNVPDPRKQMTAQEASSFVRNHWHIEAGLHAVLDGTFNEDACKSRLKIHAQNLVIFRHLVSGILRKHEDKNRMTVSMKRTHCRNSLEYRVDVLNQAFSMAA